MVITPHLELLMNNELNCPRKTKFIDEATAMQYLVSCLPSPKKAKQMAAKGRPQMELYICNHCGYMHLGHMHPTVKAILEKEQRLMAPSFNREDGELLTHS